MLYDHAHAMQVKLCKANTRGVTITFSCLLGLDHTDRTSTAITDISALAMDEYQYMYLDGHRADEKTVWLKPYYYVLNNILHQILYPKIVDSTNLHEDS